MVASGAFGKMLTLLLEKQSSSLLGSEVFKEKLYKEIALEGGRDKKDRLPAVLQPSASHVWVRTASHTELEKETDDLRL